MPDTPSFAGGIMGLFFLVALLYGLRAFVFWYFGIGRVISLLESIDKKLGPASDPVEKTAAAQLLARSVAEFRKRFGLGRADSDR